MNPPRSIFRARRNRPGVGYGPRPRRKPAPPDFVIAWKRVARPHPLPAHFIPILVRMPEAA